MNTINASFRIYALIVVTFVIVLGHREITYKQSKRTLLKACVNFNIICPLAVNRNFDTCFASSYNNILDFRFNRENLVNCMNQKADQNYFIN